MDTQQQIDKLKAVINILSGATIRVDQLDAIQRISVCAQELKDMVHALQAEAKETGNA